MNEQWHTTLSRWALSRWVTSVIILFVPLCSGVVLRGYDGRQVPHEGHKASESTMDKLEEIDGELAGIASERKRILPDNLGDRVHEHIRGKASGAKRTDPGHIHEHIKGQVKKFHKPLMNRINIIRTQMCYSRAHLMTHKPCMKFLTKRCLKESTGEGICHGFTDQVDDACYEKRPHPSGDEEKMCRLADKLCNFLQKKCKHWEDEFEDEDDDFEKVPSVNAGPSPAPGPAPAAAEMDPDADDDGDGVPNGEDAFPNDPKETKDTDGDGIGDNADEDVDGDGVDNEEDAFPLNKNETTDTDGDGIGDNVDPDKDGDGHNNTDDAFPGDPKEWKDSDNDTIGDNGDDDRDGDGVDNDDDAFPDDPDKQEPEPHKNLTKKGADRDGDGVPDSLDVFPDNPDEWQDTDGDGMGDNNDAYPRNPNCQSATEPCDKEEDMDGVEATVPLDPATLSMKLDPAKGLPEQGYGGRGVMHINGESTTDDWVKEWPEADESIEETIERICSQNPNNDWCRKAEAKKAGFFDGLPSLR